MRQSRFFETLFDRLAPKRTVSLTINSDLVAKAKEAGMNLSEISEAAITETLMAHWRDRVAQEVRDDLEAYARYIEEHGDPAESLRQYLAELDAEENAV